MQRMKIKYKIIRKLCAEKKIKIIQVPCPDFIYMLIGIPLKYNVSKIVGYLKSKSFLIIDMQI